MTTYATPNAVKETTSASPGTGSFVFTGGANVHSQFQSMAAGLANADVVMYSAYEAGVGREVGIGTWTEATGTLTRDTVNWSTSSNAKVNFTGRPIVTLAIDGEWYEDLEPWRQLLEDSVVQLFPTILLIDGRILTAEFATSGAVTLFTNTRNHASNSISHFASNRGSANAAVGDEGYNCYHMAVTDSGPSVNEVVRNVWKMLDVGTGTEDAEMQWWTITAGSLAKVLVISGAGVQMPTLPTSNPAVAGALWNDGGTVKVSAG